MCIISSLMLLLLWQSEDDFTSKFRFHIYHRFRFFVFSVISFASLLYSAFLPISLSRLLFVFIVFMSCSFFQFRRGRRSIRLNCLNLFVIVFFRLCICPLNSRITELFACAKYFFVNSDQANDLLLLFFPSFDLLKQTRRNVRAINSYLLKYLPFYLLIPRYLLMQTFLLLLTFCRSFIPCLTCCFTFWHRNTQGKYYARKKCKKYRNRKSLVHVIFFLQTPCCGKFYKCRYCHDENEDHHFDRKTLTELICANCDTRQKVQAECERCGVRFGKVSFRRRLFTYKCFPLAKMKNKFSFFQLETVHVLDM